ncbi:26511_t:CDS:1, partial [Gigaspora margarita]
STYLAYDKVLETYSIKFVKQEITRKSEDNKNLYQQIKRSQDEIERLLVLDKFINTVININDCPAPN